jgi:hypothetical protein
MTTEDRQEILDRIAELDEQIAALKKEKEEQLAKIAEEENEEDFRIEPAHDALNTKKFQKEEPSLYEELVEKYPRHVAERKVRKKRKR